MTTTASADPDAGSEQTTGPGGGPAAPGRPSAAAILRNAGPSLLVDVALPYLVYLLLTGQGLSEVSALAWSCLPPALGVLVTAARARRLNGVGVIVLCSIGIGIATSLISDDPTFAVARDAVPNVVIAVLLAGSLLCGGRPLLFHLLRAVGGTYRPGLREILEHQWAVNPHSRTVLRRATAVGAAILLAEAGLRLLAAELLPVAVALPVLQVQSVVVWAGMVLLLRRALVRAGRRPVAGSDRPAATA